VQIAALIPEGRGSAAGYIDCSKVAGQKSKKREAESLTTNAVWQGSRSNMTQLETTRPWSERDKFHGETDRYW
jgi:hypothetical protein